MPKSSQLDLVLVNPGDRIQTYQSMGTELAAIEPPVWAGLMATFMRRLGYSVQIVDSNGHGLSAVETAERVAELDAVLTAVVVYGHQPSASTQNMPAAGAVCNALKQQSPDQKILLLGGHVSSLPETTIREESAEFVCMGEGLYTLSDLVECLKSSRQDLSKVRGLWYWEGDRLHSNPAPPLVQDLDLEMPEMAWDLLPMDNYRAHNWHCFGDLQRQPYAAIYTTLGCPYHCSFCCIQAPFKAGEQESGIKLGVNSYRFWSPETVIKQIDNLVTNYGVKNIKFADEMFVLNRRHVIGLCDLIIERGYDLNIWAYARVDTVKDGMVDKMKQAGFNWLALGIEAASEDVRKEVEKGFDQALIYSTVDAVRGAGINVIGNYIFGLPEDNAETMQATLDMALDLNCEFASFYCAMAYPGSPLYQSALANGWRLPEKWSGYSQHSIDTLPLPTKYLSGPEVLRFRDNAFQVYFNDTRYQEMIAAKFGPATNEHIQSMKTHTPERKFA